MINTEKLMKCNAVVNCLMEANPEITEEEVIKTEIFVINNYENFSLIDWNDTDLEKYYYYKPEIINYYLRAQQDCEVIKITDTDELVDYLLKRYYSNKNKNEFEFLSNDLYKELFIINMTVFENSIAKNVYYVNGNYYVYEDEYTFKHRDDLFLNYCNNDDYVPF